jgi:cephalosporin hydroxylase
MITIDPDSATATVTDDQGIRTYKLGSPEGFALISRLWLRAGWDAKYVYGFTWMGRPIIQLPDDLIRIQEVIFSIKPDVIVETGIAHGGSLVFYASLCRALGKGRVIGIDIDIRAHNRAAIEDHPLYPLITLVEGSSIDPVVVAQVKALVHPGETAIVLLDSCHTRAHVLAELKAYAPVVSRGSYIVAMDGIMEQVAGGPRTQPDWTWNNPKSAALEFVATNRDFAIEEPHFLFNEGDTTERVTYWPCGFVKRVT